MSNKMLVDISYPQISIEDLYATTVLLKENNSVRGQMFLKEALPHRPVKQENFYTVDLPESGLPIPDVKVNIVILPLYSNDHMTIF